VTIETIWNNTLSKIRGTIRELILIYLWKKIKPKEGV